MHLHGFGCSHTLKLIKSYKSQYGENVLGWPLPTGQTHSEILLREVILKATGRWHYPYEHEELCHCRNIALKVVDAAIVSGAHDPETVSRLTSASTACGTCRLDVEKIIDYRLGRVG